MHYVVQKLDSISETNLAVIVHISRFQAGRLIGDVVEQVEEELCVVNTELAILVHVAAQKA